MTTGDNDKINGVHFNLVNVNYISHKCTVIMHTIMCVKLTTIEEVINSGNMIQFCFIVSNIVTSYQ